MTQACTENHDIINQIENVGEMDANNTLSLRLNLTLPQQALEALGQMLTNQST